MNSDLRRAKRYHDFIPVFVTAPKGMNTIRATGPFSGRIINISRFGGCLLIPFGVLDTYKVCNVSVRDASPFLEIQESVSLKNGHFKLPVRPVWTDPFIMDDLRAFKVGIEFLVNPEGGQINNIIESIHLK